MMCSKGFKGEIGRYVYAPGTVPYVFYVELTVEAFTAVGVLEKLSESFAERNIPILRFTVVDSGGVPIIIAIADVKGGDRVADEVAKALKQTPFARSVWYVPPIINGAAVDMCLFPLLYLGDRAVIFSKPVYEGFIREGWRVFGTAFPIMLYIVGFGSGRLASQTLRIMAGDERYAYEKLGEAIFTSLGFGRLEIVRVDDRQKEAVVRVYDNFECEIFKGAGEIRSGLVRGFIAGWLAERWGIEKPEDILAREEKCIAKGNTFCEFRVSIEKR